MELEKLQVRVCSGKPMTIVASRKGFYPAGKRLLLCHSLVSLLQQISRVFDAVSFEYKLTCRFFFFNYKSQSLVMFVKL